MNPQPTATMTYVEVPEPGPPHVMRIARGPVPEPGPGEILIRVAHAGVNRPDCAQRAGAYPAPPGASPILGLEVAGEVVACGSGAAQWRIGDLVCALTPGGGYAQYVVTPAGHALPIPFGLETKDAAALPETYFTVWNNVVDRGRLQPGETLLVHGGAGGIGVAAIQLAKQLGATVYTTVSSPAKAEFCLGLGADHAINYRAEDFGAVIADLTGGRGVDVILDCVGGDYVAANLRCLAMEGRLVQIAFLGGAKVELNLMPILLRRLTITGSTLRASPAQRKVEIAQALRERVWPLLAAGRIRPLVEQVFPLGDVATAHALMESGKHLGKIVLAVPQPDPGA